uniref:Uncharacterized protein n=1 Tax=candidate division WOR-3 bacterium TaxID=2052148 RepID=A0A7V3KPB6_UNCW3
MKIGDIVSHDKYGRGTIKLVIKKPDGLYFRVDFGFAKITVPAKDLCIEGKGYSPEPEKPTEVGGKDVEQPSSLPTFPPPNQANLEARQGINALKLGQILEAQVHTLSVGIEALEDKFKEVVDKAARSEPAFLLIEGAWGSGKTHALTLLQALARKRGFASAAIIMDGHSASLSKPMELMGEVTNALQFPTAKNVEGLAAWLREAMRQKKMRELRVKGAPLIGEALESLFPGTMDDPEASQVVEDYFSLILSTSQAKYKLSRLNFPAPGLPTLKASRVAERPQAFRELLANWAHFAKVMGATGLLIIFDELDVEYAYTAWRTQYCAQLRERRHYLLSEFKNLRGAPLAVAFASVPGLALSSNDTENDAIEHLGQVYGSRLTQVTVPIPSQEQMQELFRRIFECYNLAYESSPIVLPESERLLLFKKIWDHYTRNPNPVPRRFVRLSLEVFDLLCTGPKQRIKEILEAL